MKLDRIHELPISGAEASDAPVEPLPSLAAPTPDDEGATAENAASEHATADGVQNNRDMPLFKTAIPRYMPVALRGTREVLIHQNIIADVEGLSRIQDDAQLTAMVRDGDLVPLSTSAGLEIDPRLPFNRRYSRPWTAEFLRNLARAHLDVFGRPLQLTSAVRTVRFQRHLAHYNGNAAPTSGDTASPHLTGEAIDLGKKGMSLREIAWMRAVLGELQASGKIDVEEEFEQACFHISVYKTYAPHSVPTRPLVASNEAAPEPIAPEANAPAGPAIGAIAEPVHVPARRSIRYRHVRSYYVHHARRASFRRASVRRRRHHRSMSLLAAGLR